MLNVLLVLVLSPAGYHHQGGVIEMKQRHTHRDVFTTLEPFFELVSSVGTSQVIQVVKTYTSKRVFRRIDRVQMLQVQWIIVTGIDVQRAVPNRVQWCHILWQCLSCPVGQPIPQIQRARGLQCFFWGTTANRNWTLIYILRALAEEIHKMVIGKIARKTSITK